MPDCDVAVSIIFGKLFVVKRSNLLDSCDNRAAPRLPCLIMNRGSTSKSSDPASPLSRRLDGDHIKVDWYDVNLCRCDVHPQLYRQKYITLSILEIYTYTYVWFSLTYKLLSPIHCQRKTRLWSRLYIANWENQGHQGVLTNWSWYLAKAMLSWKYIPKVQCWPPSLLLKRNPDRNFATSSRLFLRVLC